MLVVIRLVFTSVADTLNYRSCVDSPIYMSGRTSG